MEMELTIVSYCIVCVLVFLAGFVDAIGGGGGLISLPAYLLVGLPAHAAIATNKLSSCVGTVFSTGRYLRNGCVKAKLIFPTVLMALLGSALGAKLCLYVDDRYLKGIMLFVLPVVACMVIFKKDVLEGEKELPFFRQLIITTIASLLIGLYDGFYGPGTGTFLVLVFTGIAKMNVKEASGNAKCVNLASNVAALVTFLLSGTVVISLGLVAAIFSILGHYIGAGLVVKNGAKIVRPIIIVVVILMMAKIILGYIS